jgi:DNA adenine methylase
MNIDPVIKWTGSKRNQADAIISYFPKDIDAYYEPFLGGGSIAIRLMNSPDHKVKHYILSDINSDLFSLWNEIKHNPAKLMDEYNARWCALNMDEDMQRKKDYYYGIRERFNLNRDPADFLFLSRTATSGLIRFNSKNEFNSSFHFGRPGIDPVRLRKITDFWSSCLNKNNVTISQASFTEIDNLTKNDFLYCDPPYAVTKAIYNGGLNLDEFFQWLRDMPCKYAFSFDGKKDGVAVWDNVPKDLYARHLYLAGGKGRFTGSSTDRSVVVEESLYLSYN